MIAWFLDLAAMTEGADGTRDVAPFAQDEDLCEGAAAVSRSPWRRLAVQLTL